MNSVILIFAVISAAPPRQADLVDFDTEVAPILSKAGCNAAACHGSASGRGGFKLSLFGGDAAMDFEAIVRDREGRLLRFDKPEDSLLLAKPTGMLEHEGGFRMEADSEFAGLIARWIAQGADRHMRFELEDVSVTPSHHITSAPAEFPIKVTARFRSQTGRSITRDVTRIAVYESSDTSALDVAENGVVSLKRRGRSVLVVRFLSRVLTVQVSAPLADAPIESRDAIRVNWIDDEVLTTLKQLRIPLSPQATDAELIRRLTLDLTGRLPTPDEAERFANDKSSGKYEALVERLMQSDAFDDYWCFRLMSLLRVGGSVRDEQANSTYANWIRKQITDRRALTEVATDLLVAVGDTHENGPANFYRTGAGARKQAEFISEALMGVRLRCANCHNHPLDRWKQDDYHGLSALLANVEAGQTVRLLKGRHVKNPKTGLDAIPKIPGEQFIEPDGDGRVDFAKWLTKPDNAFFGKAMVNRLWKSLMGRGLVEPADDIRATNPASHPELLTRLEREFWTEGARLRPTLKTIVLSAAYRRSSRTRPGNENDDRFYSHRRPKTLEAEVLVDAISDVSGVAETFGLLPEQTRAVQLFDPKTPSKSLDVLGRCSREESCEVAAGAEVGGGLSARLHLLNGKLLNEKIASPSGRLQKMLKQGDDNRSIIEAFYWQALSRPPSESELSYWNHEIPKGPDRKAAFEDFVWSLLSSSAFSNNR
jgi:hypothetical protein